MRLKAEQKLEKSIDASIARLKERCPSDDLVAAPATCAGRRCAFVWCDGMIDQKACFEQFFKPAADMRARPFDSPVRIMNRLTDGKRNVVDAKRAETYDEIMSAVMSGAAALFMDGCDFAATFAAPGFGHRAVTESYTEENLRSSREGFVEPIKINMTLLRRRIKSDSLVFESFKVGRVSNTDAALVYIRERVSEKLIKTIRERLERADIDLVLESGFVEPFLERKPGSLFSGVGHTERPDTLCAKINEGRVGVLIDGTPFAIVVPYLFTENFQCFDDYTNKPYYASAIRVLKYFSFVVSVLFPGSYVAFATFNPEVIPSVLLGSIAESQAQTPLPMMYETLFMTIVYEAVREAGLRLPRPVGHAVGLIGALVVGEAAINAGIVGPSTVMVVAFAAICSFTVPLLHEPITVLRFLFIVVSGLIGPLGIMLGVCVVLLSICSVNTYGVAYASQFSPYSRTLWRDGLIRRGWTKLAKDKTTLADLPGSRIDR